MRKSQIIFNQVQTDLKNLEEDDKAGVVTAEELEQAKHNLIKKLGMAEAYEKMEMEEVTEEEGSKCLKCGNLVLEDEDAICGNCI